MKYSSERKFIVWSPTGTTNPIVIHKNKQAANYAAKRMVKKYPEQTFYVMAQMGRAKTKIIPKEGGAYSAI